MRIGFVGAGKLGFPMALALDHAGHEVVIWDSSPQILDLWERREWPHVENHVSELLQTHRIKWQYHPAELDCEVAFVAVQTPHKAEFGGTLPLLEPPEDFDYQYLTAALESVDAPIVAVVSTVLPGTWKRLYQHKMGYVYNPSFIAMGTVIDDLKRAEFNLIGAEGTNVDRLVEIWRTLNDAPIFETGITEAEAVKVAYNSFISTKIALANTWGWLGEKVGFNAEVVMEALSLADRRLLSRAYLQPGMGDGGACHPRDALAMSWLADQYGVFDLFGSLTRQREAHTQWLASFIPDGCVIFGRSFKPDSLIDAGSPALLLAHYLTRQGKTFVLADDPEPGVFNFIATAHKRYRDIEWPDGSVVIDPHGIIREQAGMRLVRPGR